MKIRQNKPFKILTVYSVGHEKEVSTSFVKTITGNILQENHAIQDNGIIDALRLNSDLTNNFISDTFKYSFAIL